MFIKITLSGWYSLINFGYKEIYVHGVESNLFKNLEVNTNNEIYILEKHVYGEKIRNLTKEGEYKKGELYKKLRADSDLFFNYLLVNNYAKIMNVNLINCTPGSLIDSLKKFPG